MENQKLNFIQVLSTSILIFLKNKKQKIWNFIIASFILFSICSCSNQSNNISVSSNSSLKFIFNKNIVDKNLQIFSSFKDGGHIPDIYSCEWNNINPPIKIEKLPENTKTLAIIVDDPDAPNGDWVHWVVWNIKPENIKENCSWKWEFEEWINSWDIQWYDWPCPPKWHWIHHYHFKIYALNTILDLSNSTNKQDLEKAMSENIIWFWEIVGLYERK